MIPGYTDFEFDLPEALLKKLRQIFDDPTWAAAPLLKSNVDVIPDAQGVYQLFFDNVLCYIGKTDQDAGLKKRLNRHAAKIQHRHKLDPARITFKAVRLYVFTAIDLESQLIKDYGVDTWNGSGFGSNDPGRERDTTNYKEEHFDYRYPINIDLPLSGIKLPTTATAADVFKLLREVIPYTFRAQNKGARSRKPHPDIDSTIVTIPPTLPLTAKDIIVETVKQLPPGWQAVLLPSHIILYKDSKIYPSGLVLARS